MSLPGVVVAQPKNEKLGICGYVYSRDPGARKEDTGPRPCTTPKARHYTPKYKGIAYESLDLDSEQCFVPDESYQLLDRVIGTVITRVKTHQAKHTDISKSDLVLTVSKTLGDVLLENGFRLWTRTQTLGDALHSRHLPGETPRHLIDCDTSSLMLLTIAPTFSLSASLVEIRYDTWSSHNYVRWHVDGQTDIDWDTNGRQQCRTPEGLTGHEGRNMTYDEVIGYLRAVRSGGWRDNLVPRLADVEAAIRLHPQWPLSHYVYAWLIANRSVPDRDAKKKLALASAEKIVAYARDADFLNTLACAQALNGDFAAAIKTQIEAISLAPSDKDYRAQLEGFSAPKPQDCTPAN